MLEGAAVKAVKQKNLGHRLGLLHRARKWIRHKFHSTATQWQYAQPSSCLPVAKSSVLLRGLIGQVRAWIAWKAGTD